MWLSMLFRFRNIPFYITASLSYTMKKYFESFIISYLQIPRHDVKLIKELLFKVYDSLIVTPFVST
jgi:hypothetical protein